VRRGAASCQAVLSSCPVAGVVGPRWQVPSPQSRHGLPIRQMLQPKHGLVAQRTVAVAVAVGDVRTPDTGHRQPAILSALSASCVRRAGVRPLVRWPSGRPLSTRRVRSGRPADACPVSAASASALSASRWVLVCVSAVGQPRWRRTGVRRAEVGSASGLVVCSSRPWRKGMAVRGWHEDRRQRPGRRLGCAPAAGTAWRPRELVQRRGAGRLAGKHDREQVLTSPPQLRPCRLPA
jgi:hypothetical protein